jgi:hypothetical protein
MSPRPNPSARIRDQLLRYQLDPHRAGEHLLLCFRIETDVARHHLAHGARGNELADAHTRHCSVVRNHGEIVLTLAQQLVDEAFGRAHAHEASDHQSRAVRYAGDRVV